MTSPQVIRIDDSRYAGKKLQYQYTTDWYYDISTSSVGVDGWVTKLELKRLPATLTKHFESQLFEPYVENPIAFKSTINGADCGFMQLGFESWNKRMRVWEILIDSKFRKLGLGSLLIEKAKAEAQLAGARMLILETQSCNFPAIKFYLKHGFKFVGFDLASYTNEDLEKKEVRLEFGLSL